MAYSVIDPTLTTGATTLRQALRHGVAHYFQIPSILVVFTVICAAGLSLWPKLAPRFGRLADAFWWLWVAGLVFSFAWTVHQRQAYTVPFAQSRILFIWAALYAVLMWRSNIPLARRFDGRSVVGMVRVDQLGFCYADIICGSFVGLAGVDQ